MCAFVPIVKLSCFTMQHVSYWNCHLRSLRFENYKKSSYVSMREHLRHMLNMISELVDIGYELTDEQ